MRRSRVRFGAEGLLLFLLAATTAASPSPQSRQTAPPVFGSGVALVAVPVFVTDKDGRSVAGLKAEDFEIHDNGQRVPIVGFQAVDVDDARPIEARRDLPGTPLAMQAEAPRQFLLLIDQTFSPVSGLFFGRKAAADFVRKTLAPGDLVSVAISGRNGLRVLTSFTADHENVARALEGKALVGGAGLDPLGVGGELTTGGSDSLIDQAMQDEEAQLMQALKEQYLHRVTAFLGDLSNLVKALAPLRGRKQIVLMSAGFGEWAWMQPISQSNKAEGEPLFQRMKEIFAEAGRSDVLIHSVSLDGLKGPVNVGSPTGRDTSMGGDLRVSAENADGRGTLISFARNTGGRFIPPTGDFGQALREVDRISRHSYVLAFETADATTADTKPHSLKVSVRRDGLSVSHRTHYAPIPPTPPSDPNAVRMLAVEAISKGLSGGALRLHVTPLPYRDAGGATTVHTVLAVDGQALADAAQGDQLAIQVYGYVMSEGRVRDSISMNTSLDLKVLGSALRASGFRLVTSFPASPGEMDMRFFVRAGASGVTGSIRRTVTVPAFSGRTLTVSAPMFALPIAGRVVVPYQASNHPRAQIPFRLGAEPFVPEAAVTLAPGGPREATIFVWPARGASAPPLEVVAELQGDGGGVTQMPVTTPPRVLRDVDGFDRYVVSVSGSAPAAARGPQTLRLIFRDPATGATAVGEASVWVGDPAPSDR